MRLIHLMRFLRRLASTEQPLVVYERRQAIYYLLPERLCPWIVDDRQAMVSPN